MPELAIIFILLFGLIPFFYYLNLPLVYMQWTLIVIIVLLMIPLIKTLFNAPFVPSSKKRVKTMIKLADLNSKKRVIELGCGDGRIIREAAKIGVKDARGYEISLILILYARIVGYFKKSSAKILYGDIWKQDYSNTDIIFSYLLPMIMPKVKEKIWSQLPSGAYFISNGFPLPDIKEDKKEEGVYLYIKK